MKSKSFKLDSPQAHKLKIASGIGVGIGMFPFLFWGLDSLKGRHGDLGEWGEQWWPIGLCFMLIGIGIGVYATYWYYSTLTINDHPALGLQVEIVDPGSQSSKNGKWKWYAYFVEVPIKYGLTKKECHLVLFHKEMAFCEFVQELGALTEDPAREFVQLPLSITLPAEIYRTRSINEILAVVMSSTSAEQVQPVSKKAHEETQQVKQPTPAKTASNVDKSQPEYGDPDYDL